MMKSELLDILEFLRVFGVIFAILMAFVFMICTPFAYLEGSAKSEWLKLKHNVDMPWYKAAFLDVNTQDINANIK